MNNNINSKEYNASRGRGRSVTLNGQQSIGKGGVGGYVAGDSSIARGRGSTRGSEQFNRTTQNKTLVQRTVTNEDVEPKELTALFKHCRTFVELNSLYHGQKDKPYFNFIHASACFSQAIRLFTQFNGHNNITKVQLEFFRDKVLSYSESFDGRSFSNVANDAVKLLKYAEKNDFKGAEEIAKIACETLACVFEEFNSREGIQKTDNQALANIANDAIELLNYAQRSLFKGAKEAEKLACKTLSCVFRAVNKKEKLQNCNTQDLANLANDTAKLLKYALAKNLIVAEEDETLAWNTLSGIFQEVNRRKALQDFTPQELTNLANDAVELLNYAQKKKNFKDAEEAEKLVCKTLFVLFQEVNNREDFQDFESQNFSNLANDAVKFLSYAQKKRFKDIEETEKLAYSTLIKVCQAVNSKENLQDFSSQTLSNLANDAVEFLAYVKKKKIKNPETSEKLACRTLLFIFQAVNSRGDLKSFDPQALANLANDAVKLLAYTQKKSFNNPEEAKKLACNTLSAIFQAVQTKGNLHIIAPQALANLANGAVEILEHTQNKYFKSAEEAENLVCTTLFCIFQAVLNSKDLQGFKAQELANLTNDATRFLDYTQNKFVKGSEQTEKLAYSTLTSVFQTVKAKGNLQNFNSHDLAMVANNAVKFLKYAGSEEDETLACNTLCYVFQAVNNRGNLQNFLPQHLSNLANDAAKLLAYAQKKYSSGAGELEKLACDTLSVLFQAVNSRENFHDFGSQNLSNLANDAVQFLDYAQKKRIKSSEEIEKLGCKTLITLFQEVSNRGNLHNTEPQHLTNLANDAVKLLRYAQATKNKNFKNAEVAEKLAYSTLTGVFQAVKAKGNFDDFDQQNFSNLANAVVQAGYWDDTTSELLTNIGKDVCTRNFNRFTLQGICNLAWSFSIGNKLALIDSWLIEGLAKLNIQQINKLSMEEAKQLYMAFLQKALDSNKWTKTNPNAFLAFYLNKDLVQKILQEVNVETEIKDLVRSKLQKNVSRVLQKILPKDCSFEEEYYIKPYPIDFAVFRQTDDSKTKKLIALIEVNGPLHFMRNGDYHLSHKFKETLLKDMGYGKIINVNYIEWDKSKDQESLMNQKLSKIFASNGKNEAVLLDGVNQKEEALIKLNESVNKSPLIKARKKGRIKAPDTNSIVETTILSKKSNEMLPLQSNAGIEPARIDNSIRKQQVASNALSDFQVQKDHKSKIIIDNEKNDSSINEEGDGDKIYESESVKPFSIMEFISFYGRSTPALALYLLIFALSFNTLKHWNFESK